MQSRNFDVVSFMSRGKYSLIYEVAYTQGSSRITNTTWAMKRFYLQNYSSVRCALRERNILVRLARAEKQSPFLTTLLESFQIHGAPAFVLRKGCGLDLQDLFEAVGYFREFEAQFYACEIISGLGHLHAMQIVHLDVKPSNMLLDDSGHLFITDFDRSYDASQDVIALEKTDFTGTSLYMSPEVMNKIDITPKADVWSLGVLVAVTMYSHFSVSKWLKSGELILGHVPYASMHLRKFLRACLVPNCKTRLDIKEVKGLGFFKDIKWEEVVDRKIKPPYRPSYFKFAIASDKFRFDPYDPLLLAAAFGTRIPLVNRYLRDVHDKEGVRRLIVKSINYRDLLRSGLTSKKIGELFANFDFQNYRILPSSPRLESDRVLIGGEDVPSEHEHHVLNACSSPPGLNR
ncbi:unnamed protein product [Hydatigera taeniaeformis]|uniref:Protein kinase domain-containing protein n=1 Tax=Hydatigena taeniaeformis TaxID=6205 RepID=A0A0R3XAD3_HYDTA|nr:unnamed protein product [Hydatigera taeniaeformis]